MIELLARRLIADRENVKSPAVRQAYGTLCGAAGIALNRTSALPIANRRGLGLLRGPRFESKQT